MKRKISSLATFLMKVIFPVIWIPGFGLGTLAMFLGRADAEAGSPKWAFLFAWVAGSAFIYWGCTRLKVVSVDDNYLYISNYLREARVPLSDIYNVTENRWVNIHPVTIHLRQPSDFGAKIVFMPQAYFSFFGSHPVVSELKELASSRGRDAKYSRGAI